jgi:hypothetical protein
MHLAFAATAIYKREPILLQRVEVIIVCLFVFLIKAVAKCCNTL